MGPARHLEFKAKVDSSTEHPGDLAFDRPTPEELLDIAWSLVADLESCGFSLHEMRTIADRMTQAVDTRTGGVN